MTAVLLPRRFLLRNSLLPTHYSLFATLHCHSPDLSTPPARMRYSPSFRFIEGVLRRRSGAEAE